METRLEELLTESIRLEKNIGTLYFLFARVFEKDYLFWRGLAREESNHASLLMSGRDDFLPLQLFPAGLICDRKELLEQMNEEVEKRTREYEAAPPGIEEALYYAYEIENSAGELHFQCFVENGGNSVASGLFRELVDGDKDHARRIKAYSEDRLQKI